MAEPTREFQCDGCGETWDVAFYCDICSSGGHLEEVTSPKLIWYGVGSEYETRDEWVPNGSICGNCCPGHGSGTDEENEKHA